MLKKTLATLTAAIGLSLGLNPLPALAIFSNTYDTVVNAIECGADATTNWFSIEPRRYGIVSGHNINPQRGGVRLTDKTWILQGSANTRAGTQSAGYRITIVRISAAPRGRSQGFKDIAICFKRDRSRRGTLLVNLNELSIRAIPQDPSIPAKVLRFDQMRVRPMPDPADFGWEVVEANNADFGISNTTFVRTFDVTTSSFNNVEFGKFSVRSHFADNLDRCTLNFNSVTCN